MAEDITTWSAEDILYSSLVEGDFGEYLKGYKTPEELEKITDVIAKFQFSVDAIKNIEDSLTGAIFDRIKGFFIMQATSMIKSIVDVQDILFPKSQVEKILNDAFNVAQNPDQINNVLRSLKEILIDVRPLGIIVGVVIAMILMLVQLSGTGLTLLERAKMTANAITLPRIVDVETLIAYITKEGLKYNSVEELVKLNGYDKNQFDILYRASRQVLDLSMLISLVNRGIISDEEFRKSLLENGYRESDLEKIDALRYPIPPISDLISMAVKEAFSPSVAERFGQYEDYPEILTQYAQQQGISEEWAKRYWASHWSLPSPQMGFEMLHRGIISHDELRLLLRALDIMPYWRDKLIELSYAPYTRVDIRRMYQLGVLTEEEVYKAYKEIGYDDEKARKLTQYTIVSVIDDEKELTKNECLTFFKSGVIKENECRDILRRLNYSPDIIEMYINKINLELITERKNKLTNGIKKRYLSGVWDENKTVVELAKLDLPTEEINNLLEDWDIEKRTQYRDLSEATLKNAYIYGLLDKSTTLNRLKNYGYTVEDSEIIIKLWEAGK